MKELYECEECGKEFEVQILRCDCGGTKFNTLEVAHAVKEISRKDKDSNQTTTGQDTFRYVQKINPSFS